MHKFKKALTKSRDSEGSGQYDPPPGPPPSWRPTQQEYAPPPGPPPSHSQSSSHGGEYAPPAGPPPGYSDKKDGSSSSEPAPPPYQPHDWTSVPDTALLPPPPSIHNVVSPTANASEHDATRARDWCARNRLSPPYRLSAAQINAIQTSQIGLSKPSECHGEVLPQQRPGTFRVRTHAKCHDCCLLTSYPVYTPFTDSPFHTERPKTIYFEVHVLGIGRAGGHQSFQEADAGVAIGFVAPPYPTWRLPGWQRGSLAVHGDDGRRYVNDPEGGADFTTAFKTGDTVGIGMVFGIPSGPNANRPKADVQVFFTRNGKREDGWDLHEQRDADTGIEGGVIGLEGEHDLLGAVGVFGGCDFAVRFAPGEWMYRPPGT